MESKPTPEGQRRRSALDRDLKAMFDALKRGTPAELLTTLMRLEAGEQAPAVS